MLKLIPRLSKLAMLATTMMFMACTSGEAPPATGHAGTTGQAGTIGQAGTTGLAGTTGQAGTGGTADGGDSAAGTGGVKPDAATDAPAEAGIPDGGVTDGKAPIVRSAGCTKPATQDLAKYVRKTVSGSTRVYDLRLPTGYDPERAYPVVFLAHGCDGSIPYPMENATKGDAILVAPRAKDSQNSGQLYGGGCFDTMPKNSPEIAYFDQMLADVTANQCVDTSRVFITGHSSGSWLSYLIGCARGGGTLRGEGNTAGGLPPGIPTCSGPVAAMMMHDTTDTLNVFAEGEKARDRILAINKCGKTTVPYEWDGDPKTASPCVQYQGCSPGAPVVWCPTTGLGHSTQVPMSTVGLWRFWSQL